MRSNISKNLKHLRKRTGLTQEQLASKIGIKRSLLGAYEEGRAEPNLINLQKFAKVFSISTDVLISDGLTELELSDLDLEFENRSDGIAARAISSDLAYHHNIHLIAQKAEAGYMSGYSDPEYMADLPTFSLPMLKNGTYRAFEISGDSMLPITSGSVIVGSMLAGIDLVKDGKAYILVTRHDGIVFKRVYRNADEECLNLVSDNPIYRPYTVTYQEVLEIWEAKAFISTEFPAPGLNEHGKG